MPSTSQIAELNKQLVLSGIKEWHDKGYKGISPRTKKAQVFWNTEYKGGDGHGESCSKRVWDANPTAIIHHAPMAGSCPNYIVTYNNKTYTVEQFIVEYKIMVSSSSFSIPFLKSILYILFISTNMYIYPFYSESL